MLSGILLRLKKKQKNSSFGGELNPKVTHSTLGFFLHRNSTERHLEAFSSWWLVPQPLWKICEPSKWVKIFPKFRGENSKHLWVATTQFLSGSQCQPPKPGSNIILYSPIDIQANHRNWGGFGVLDDIFLGVQIWVFPKIGVPPNHQF